MPFAAGTSSHPVTATAVGEVVGQVMDDLGDGPDLATLFVTTHHGGAIEDAAGAVRALLRPGVLFGCVAVSVVGTNVEIEQEPGVTLWAGRGGAVAPVEVEAGRTNIPDAGFSPTALLLVADPFSVDVEAVLAGVADHYPGVPVIGGNASAGARAGGNRLLAAGGVRTTGAVGALLGPGWSAEAVVSQGCRPIGSPWVVTRAEGNVIHELAGEPPLTRLMRLAEHDLTEDEIALVNHGLQLGVVVDERREEFGRGDFIIRAVLGADRSTGAMAVGEAVEVGTTVQFQVRDAATASEDLHALLSGHSDAHTGARGRSRGALLFTCTGRGRALFGTRSHDARAIDDVLGCPTGGFFANGEFGPVGDRNFVHGYTASIALFRE
ncbi:MAG TPA: FIST N-terminal domain-containing protein [Acidimicrobiales bacterium]|nr:FIST N-terminal domain-containing protein [Acidimicrobiales bacterium]